MVEQEKIQSDELQHWGIRGMRWGIRRYQNKDGSLTPAGEKRRAKLEKELGKLDSKPGANTSKSASAKKSIKDMSDEELRNQTNRWNLELNYINTQQKVAALDPKQARKNKINEIGKKALDAGVDASINAGRAALQGFLTRELTKTLKDIKKDAVGTKKVNNEKPDTDDKPNNSSNIERVKPDSKGASVERVKIDKQTSKKGEIVDLDYQEPKKPYEVVDLDYQEPKKKKEER